MARARKPGQKKSTESNETLARKIWLAGLGAYGKSVEDAHEQIDKASHEASKLFHDLVSKGQSIEDQNREAIKARIDEAKDRLNEARERVSEAAGSRTRSVEEMIDRVRDKMGIDDPAHARLDALARQVNSLARKVTGLSLRKSRGEGEAEARLGRSPGRAAKPRATRKPPARSARRGR